VCGSSCRETGFCQFLLAAVAKFVILIAASVANLSAEVDTDVNRLNLIGRDHLEGLRTCECNITET
jgi:hypothetical protein